MYVVPTLNFGVVGIQQQLEVLGKIKYVCSNTCWHEGMLASYYYILNLCFMNMSSTLHKVQTNKQIN